MAENKLLETKTLFIYNCFPIDYLMNQFLTIFCSIALSAVTVCR